MTKERLTVATDWDGTFTDPEKMEVTYSEIVVSYLAKKLGMKEWELSFLMQRARELVVINPAKYGWIIDGRTVAYPTDHYLMVMATALKAVKMANEAVTPEVIAELSNDIFTSCAPRLTTIYKAEAGEVLHGLLNSVDLVVVTNSSTGKVEGEVKQLLGCRANEVVVKGGAKKMVIDPEFMKDKLPIDFKGMYGFPRLAHLRRPFYFKLLTEIFGDISKARVMGDNGQLDLLIADYAGGKTGLVTSALAMDWEKEYWSTGQNRKAGSLKEVAEWIVE